MWLVHFSGASLFFLSISSRSLVCLHFAWLREWILFIVPKWFFPLVRPSIHSYTLSLILSSLSHVFAHSSTHSFQLSIHPFTYVSFVFILVLLVSRLGLVVRRSAGKRKDPGTIKRFGSPFSLTIVIYGHCLVILPSTINDTLNGSHRCPS